MRRLAVLISLFLLPAGLMAQPRDYYADAEELYYAGKYSEAIKTALEGCEAGDEEGLIDLYSILGASYSRLGAFDKAAEYMIRCYESDKAAGEVKGLTSSLVNLASMYVYAGSPELAVDYALEAIENEKAVGRPDKLAMAYGKACDVYHAIGCDTTALRYADRAVEISRESLDEAAEAIRRSQRAYPLVALGRYRDALQDLRFAERTFRNEDLRQSLAIVCFQLGQEYGREGRTALEQQYLREAADLSRELEDLPLLQKVLVLLAKSLRVTDPTAAFECLEEASAIQLKISESKSSNALELFNIEYETARREATIARQQEEIRHEKQQRSTLFIILLIILVAAGAMTVAAFRIRRSERKLRRSNAEKDFLFKVISHDLHAPAVAQLRGIQLIRSNASALGPDGQREVFLQLERQAESEVELIDNVLRWARSKSGAQQGEAVHFVVNDLVREALSQYEGGSELKGIRLVMDAPESVVVCSTRNNLLLALRNLLSNAIKFSHSGSEVIVSIVPQKDGADIRVIDHGTGIAPEHLKDIFRPEATYRRPGTDGEPSNGLGLAVSRDLVEEIGCCLSVESALGEGSTFTIHIRNARENA